MSAPVRPTQEELLNSSICAKNGFRTLLYAQLSSEQFPRDTLRNFYYNIAHLAEGSDAAGYEHAAFFQAREKTFVTLVSPIYDDGSLIRTDKDALSELNEHLYDLPFEYLDSPAVEPLTTFAPFLGGYFGQLGFENIALWEHTLTGFLDQKRRFFPTNGIPTNVWFRYDAFFVQLEDGKLYICNTLEVPEAHEGELHLASAYKNTVERMRLFSLKLADFLGVCASKLLLSDEARSFLAKPSCVTRSELHRPKLKPPESLVTDEYFDDDAPVDEEGYRTNLDQSEYEGIVTTLKKRISRGDYLQCVVSRMEYKHTEATPMTIFEELCRLSEMSQYKYCLRFGNYCVIGASPEMLLGIQKKNQSGAVFKATVHPIAGTRSRGNDEEADIGAGLELIQDEKELIVVESWKPFDKYMYFMLIFFIYNHAGS